MRIHVGCIIAAAFLSVGWVLAAATGPASQPRTETQPTASRPAFEFSKEQREHRFYADFARWNREDTAGQVPRDAVLVIGNSNIRLWTSIEKDLAPVKIIDRAFGGSNMADVLVFADFFCRYDVDRIMVYEGGNDFLDKKVTAEGLLARHKEFLAKVRAIHPETRVYFCAVMLGPARIANRDRVLRANELIQEWAAKEKAVEYIDLLAPLLDDKGDPRVEFFRKDLTHLNEKGYELWAPILRARLGAPLEKR